MKRGDSLERLAGPSRTTSVRPNSSILDSVSPTSSTRNAPESSGYGAANEATRQPAPQALPPVPGPRSLLGEFFAHVKEKSPTGKDYRETFEDVILRFGAAIASVEDMNVLYNRVRSLMNESVKLLRGISPNGLEYAKEKSKLDLDELLALLEEYVMESTYDQVFYKVVQFNKRENWALRRAVQTISHVDLPQLGNFFAFEHGVQLLKATKKFEQLAYCRSPYSKLRCLTDSVRLLFENEPLKGADLLIPLMLLMIIRSSYGLHYSSVFCYIKHFNFEHDTTSGEYGYVLSTFEAVLDYIKQNLGSLQELCREQGAFFDLVCKDSEVELKKWFASNPQASVLAKGRDWEGNDAVLLAVKSTNVNMIKYLVDEREFSLKRSKNYHLESPLHVLASVKETGSTFEETFTLLMETDGGTVEQLNDFGESPFLLACLNGNEEMLRLLLRRPELVNVNRQNLRGESGLHLAIQPSLVQYLVENVSNMDCNLRCIDGLTPLLHHAQLGHLDTVDALLLYAPKLDVNARDSGGRTCLHLCAFRGYTTQAESLLRFKNIDVNATSAKGNTPLGAACDTGYISIVQLLLENGADPTLVNSQGKRAVDFAKSEAIKNLVTAFTPN